MPTPLAAGITTRGPQLEMLELIARRRLTQVWRARWRGREVAVKILLPSAPRAAKERFSREGELCARLQHPHLLATLDRHQEPGSLFMIQELATRTLAQELDDGTRAWRSVCEDLCEALRGLGVLHSSKIIHREIKPAHLLRVDGAVKLGGLGSALDDGTSQRTGSGSFVLYGDPRYMPPEQSRPGRPVTEASDLYAFGVTAFELLSGRRPFTGSDRGELLLAHEKTPPPSLRKIAPETPKMLIEVVDRLLEKKPEFRYRTARQLRAHLEGILSGKLKNLPDLDELGPGISITQSASIPTPKRIPGAVLKSRSRRRRSRRSRSTAGPVIAAGPLASGNKRRRTRRIARRQSQKIQVVQKTQSALPTWRLPTVDASGAQRSLLGLVALFLVAVMLLAVRLAPQRFVPDRAPRSVAVKSVRLEELEDSEEPMSAAPVAGASPGAGRRSEADRERVFIPKVNDPATDMVRAVDRLFKAALAGQEPYEIATELSLIGRKGAAAFVARVSRGARNPRCLTGPFRVLWHFPKPLEERVMLTLLQRGDGLGRAAEARLLQLADFELFRSALRRLVANPRIGGGERRLLRSLVRRFGTREPFRYLGKSGLAVDVELFALCVEAPRLDPITGLALQSRLRTWLRAPKRARSALRVLSRGGGELLLPELHELLVKTRSDRTFSEICKVLQGVGAFESVPVIVPYSQARSPNRRRAVGAALRALVPCAPADGDWLRWWEEVEPLWIDPGDESRDALNPSLPVKVRLAALARLTQVRSPKIDALLIDLIGAGELRVRAAAIRGAGCSRVRGASPHLVGLLDSPNTTIVRAAHTALRQITGASLGKSSKLWLEWLGKTKDSGA